MRKKKKDKNLPDPGANSQVYILNLSQRFSNALFFGWTKFCVKKEVIFCFFSFAPKDLCSGFTAQELGEGVQDTPECQRSYVRVW